MSADDLPQVWVAATESGVVAGPVTDDGGSSAFLAWRTKAECERGCQFLMELGFYSECVPLRIK